MVEKSELPVEQLAEQLIDICRFAETARRERMVVSIGEAVRRQEEAPMRALLSLRRQIEDPYTGVVYAVRVLGQALFTIGGHPLLGKLRDRVEDELGVDAVVWLSRRWDGIE